MAGKRQAVSDLNHTNWDREEEPEDPGHFREATDEELQKRVIKKAHRRVTGENNGSSSTTTNSIFSGFSGFTAGNNASTSTAKSSPFAFLSKLPTPTSSTASATGTTTMPAFSFGSGNSKINPNTTEVKTSTITPTFSYGQEIAAKFDANTIPDLKAQGSNAYISKITKLNKSFCDWIVKHVNEQPLCNLAPTFKDYERFMHEIEQEQNSARLITMKPTVSQAVVTAATTSTAPATPFASNFKFNSTSPTSIPIKPIGFGTPTAAAAPTVSSSVESTNAFQEKTKEIENSEANSKKLCSGIKTTEKTNGSVAAAASSSTNFSFSQTTKTNGGDTEAETKSKTAAPFSFGIPLTTVQPKTDTSTGFSFGIKADAKTNSSTAFSFGLKKDVAPSTTGFSFTPGATPFTFANIKPPAAVEPQKDNNADDDDEDKPPKVEIKEIVEEDALYTKRCKVFVKKDNAYKDHGVGTFYLKPVKDSGKTQLLVRSSNNLGTILINVILVEGMPTQRMGKNNVMLVHPGSAEDAKPQTTLIRVKDGAEADELLEMINKHKK